MAAREGLGFESAIESDCASVAEPVLALIEAGIEIHCLRDLTRGGLASAVVEIAETAGRDIELDETAIPVRDDVGAACELLGLDPLHVANEGRFAAFVAPADAERALALLRDHAVSGGAAIIGSVADGTSGQRVVPRRARRRAGRRHAQRRAAAADLLTGTLATRDVGRIRHDAVNPAR